MMESGTVTCPRCLGAGKDPERQGVCGGCLGRRRAHVATNPWDGSRYALTEAK